MTYWALFIILVAQLIGSQNQLYWTIFQYNYILATILLNIKHKLIFSFPSRNKFYIVNLASILDVWSSARLIGLLCKLDILEYAVDWQNLNYRALPFYDLVPTGNFWLAKKWYARCLLMIIFSPEEQFGRNHLSWKM